MFYSFAVVILYTLFKIFFRLKIFGRENFPEEGPVIVAANHASFLDPIAVGISAPRKLNFLARESLFRSRVFAGILAMVHTYPLRRGSGDINAFRMALSKLSQDMPVLVFPEGTRSPDANLQKPRYGIGLLASMSGAPVVPCYVKGTSEAWPKHARFPKINRVSVYFGRPLKFDREFSGDKKERYMHIAETVMAAIGELKKEADR